MLCQAVSCVTVTIREHVGVVSLPLYKSNYVILLCCLLLFFCSFVVCLFHSVEFYYFIQLSFIFSVNHLCCVVLSVRLCQRSVPMGRENGLWDYLGPGRESECIALPYPNVVMFIAAFCVPVCCV